MSFQVGQKVVCVDDGPDLAFEFTVWMDGDKPTVGWVYTVTGHDMSDELARELIFISGYPKWSFLATRFRPLVESKTDIAIFTALLDGVKQKEPA